MLKVLHGANKEPLFLLNYNFFSLTLLTAWLCQNGCNLDNISISIVKNYIGHKLQVQKVKEEKTYFYWLKYWLKKAWMNALESTHENVCLYSTLCVLSICMCILHIVFCTVCKYVLSICIFFFLHCPEHARKNFTHQGTCAVVMWQ